ncbi:MAG TPA: alpha/beta hydrolase [Solirubrobacterales bacterium]|jgi:pimeloyl-ACP methyl ester carboxylesterase
MIRSEEVQLPQGTIRYRELGEGEPIVFVHGFLVDGRLWTGTAEALSATHRCILPDWPMGAHRVAMNPDADLSPPGIANLIADFLEALDLSGATIVGNDSGGAMSQVLATRRPERIGRLVLTNCDTHDNFPPSIFKAMPPLAKLPGAMTAMALPFRIGALRRAAFAPFAKTKIPAELIDSWMEPGQSDAGVRRDTAKFTAGMNKRYTLEAAERLADFDRPTLFAWAPEDRIFKLSYAERLAETIPDATIETISDAKTFVPLDQPARLAELIGAFVGRKAATPESARGA